MKIHDSSPFNGVNVFISDRYTVEEILYQWRVVNPVETADDLRLSRYNIASIRTLDCDVTFSTGWYSNTICLQVSCQDAITQVPICKRKKLQSVVKRSLNTCCTVAVQEFDQCFLYSIAISLLISHNIGHSNKGVSSTPTSNQSEIFFQVVTKFRC